MHAAFRVPHADFNGLISTSLDRAEFRLGHLRKKGSGRFVDPAYDADEADVATLRRIIREQQLRIIYLDQIGKLGGSNLNVAEKVDKPVTTRQRRTLLTVIAALCAKANIRTADRSAVSRIVSATEELGAPVGEDKVREMLRDLPAAVESRTR